MQNNNIIKWLILVFVSLVLNNFLCSQIRAIDSIFTESARQHEFSGAVLIAKNEHVIYDKVFGYSDEESKIKTSDRSVFSIASVGKVFTATLTMKLVQQKLLSLKDPISNYIPQCQIPNAKLITIEQLLSHTSGLGNYMVHPDYQSLLANPVTIDDIIPLIETQQLVFDTPGMRHEYSNSGYIILGKIIEAVTHKSYAEVLNQEILGPLGMRNTRISLDRNNLNGLAKGYWRREPGTEWASTLDLFPVPLSDGGLITNTRDLFVFIQALFNGEIIAEPYLKMMCEKHAEGELPGMGKMKYGYGLMISDFSNGTKSFGHNGGSSGYGAELRYYRMTDGTKYNVIILANHDHVIRPLFFAVQDMIVDLKI